MCLSTAYANVKSADSVMAKNITGIGFEGGEIVLTDLMGGEMRVFGDIVSVDLINGVVIINTDMDTEN